MSEVIVFANPRFRLPALAVVYASSLLVLSNSRRRLPVLAVVHAASFLVFASSRSNPSCHAYLIALFRFEAPPCSTRAESYLSS